MSLLNLFPMRIRRGKWTDDYPQRVAAGLGPVRPVSDAPSLAAELTDSPRYLFAPDRVSITLAPSRDLVTALLEDGQAQAVGHGCQTEAEALSMAATYLSDPVDGARRAMLVLTGYLGMGAADVAEAVA